MRDHKVGGCRACEERAARDNKRQRRRVGGEGERELVLVRHGAARAGGRRAYVYCVYRERSQGREGGREERGRETWPLKL